jgi:MFS transporter, YQGE family, putative transporter
VFKLRSMYSNGSIDRELLLLLLIGGLYSLSIALSSTFVNVFLWKQSGDFTNIGLYNFSSVLLQPFAFLLAGKLAKQVDRVIVLRLGVVFLSVFFLSVLLLGNKSSEFLIILGALHGLGLGFYWLSFHVLTFEITNPKTRDFFNGFSGVLGSFTGMVGPISAGWIITSMDNFKGYSLIFIISLVLFCVAVLLSFFLKRRAGKGKLELREALAERKKNKDLKYILFATFFQGFRGGTFIFLISLWVYIATNSELSLGKFALLQSSIGLISYYVVGKWIKPSQRKKSILFAGFVMYAAILIIAFNLTYFKLMIYGAIIAFVFPFLFVPFSSITYDVIGSAKHSAERRIEYMVIKELFLNGGRILSIALFLSTVTLFSPEKGIPYLLFILGPGFLIIYFFISKVNIQVHHDKH